VVGQADATGVPAGPAGDDHGDPVAGGQIAIDGEDDAVPSDTAAAVAYWHRRRPDLHPAQIAARVGRSERTVRRYWPPDAAAGRRRAANRRTTRALADRPQRIG
jgi:hypothetical protein